MIKTKEPAPKAVAKPMRKQQLFEALAETQEMTKRQVRSFFEGMRDLLHKELKRAGTFILPDMGKFNMKERKARIGRNPKTGEAIKIGKKMTLKFRVAKPLKDACLPLVVKTITKKKKV